MPSRKLKTLANEFTGWSSQSSVQAGQVLCYSSELYSQPEGEMEHSAIKGSRGKRIEVGHEKEHGGQGKGGNTGGPTTTKGL